MAGISGDVHEISCLQPVSVIVCTQYSEITFNPVTAGEDALFFRVFNDLDLAFSAQPLSAAVCGNGYARPVQCVQQDRPFFNGDIAGRCGNCIYAHVLAFETENG